MTNPNKQKTITCNTELWQQAKDKAGILSMSKLVRILLRAFVNGEIEVTFDGRVRNDRT
jgi:hypothetical protein